MKMMKRVDCLIHNQIFLETMEQLEHLELNREYCRHGWEHCMDVARGMVLLNVERNLGFRKDVLYALALVHDLGRVKEYVDNVPHEQAGVLLAGEILPACGFGHEEVAQMMKAIGCHRERQSEGDGLAELLKEADKNTRLCFCCKVSDTCRWSEEKKNKTIVL